MLNIKNPRAHELAVKVASLTGQSLTDAVIHALEAEEKRLSSPGKLKSRKELMAFLKKVHEDAPPEFLSDEDPTAWLYDENGMPA